MRAMTTSEQEGDVAPEVIAELAERLWVAETSGVATAPIRDQLPPADLNAAYAIQKVNTDRALAAGRRRVGAKAGLTSVAVQRQLGVHQPDFGVLFSDMAVADGEEMVFGRVLQAKVEAEVALVLERDVTDPDVTPAELIRAVAFALPAIEVVGSRVAGWDIKITDTVADNASSGLFVVGNHPVRLTDVDLRAAGMVLTRNGAVVSVGSGAACLGGPVTAAVWMARTLAGFGVGLRAGDVLMTGALGPMVDVSAGDVFEATVGGLGSVRAIFGS